MTKNSLFDSNTVVLGIVSLGIVDSDGINGSGSVAVINFVVKGKVGDTSPLTLESVEAVDGNTFVDIIVSTKSGIFTVSETGCALSNAAIAGIVVAAAAILVVIVIAFGRRAQKQNA